MPDIKPDYKDKNYNFYHTNGDGLHPYPDSLPLAEIEVYLHCSGMIANHNYPCPVCKVNHAVCNLHGMIMSPCWDCQEKGYQLIKKVKKDLRPWYIKMWF